MATTARVSLDLPIEGGRLRLRGLRDADMDELVEMADDPEIARWTHVPHPYTRENAAAFIPYAKEKQRLGREFHLVMEDTESRRMLGMIALTDIDIESERAEVGYWVAEHARGRGIASEALALLLEAAFEQLGLTRIYAFVLEGNVGSVKLLERIGFHEEGRLRWHTKRDGRWMDKIWYGLLREEWETRFGRG